MDLLPPSSRFEPSSVQHAPLSPREQAQAINRVLKARSDAAKAQMRLFPNRPPKYQGLAAALRETLGQRAP